MVNGAAVGAGCDFAFACDMRVGCDRSKFRNSFVKVGLIPGGGGAWFYTRLLGLGRGLEFLFTGDFLEAEEALLTMRPRPDCDENDFEDTVRDWHSANITLQRGLTGAKPRSFARWIFGILNAEPGDELVDLFPGTGAVTSAWQEWSDETEPEQLILTERDS